MRRELDELEAANVDIARQIAELKETVRLEEARHDRPKPFCARFLMAGRPVAGVTVFGTTSDDEGRVKLWLPNKYRGFLVATQPDGAQLRLDLPQDDADSTDLGDVRIAPAGTISGVVVDEDGRPVADAAVSLLCGELDCRTTGDAKTGADGRFSIGRVGPYRYEVCARVAPRPDSAVEATGGHVVAVASGAEVRIVARRMFPVVLRLVDDATGDAMIGSVITCELRHAGAPRDASLHELRHGESEVRLLLDAPGFYDVDVRWSDGLRTVAARLDAVELRADRENVVDVRLRPR